MGCTYIAQTISIIRLCFRTSRHQCPIVVDGEEEFEVEEVLDSREKNGLLESRVSWVGYSADPEWYHEFTWNAECQNAFEYLKKTFTSAPILMAFNPEKEVYIETDASDYVSETIQCPQRRRRKASEWLSSGVLSIP